MKPAAASRILATLLAMAIPGLARADEPKSAEPKADEAKVKLVAIKYDEMLKKIAENKKAKLTVVDAWATWCGPCKENFPHVVDMNKAYAKKGLAVVSLCLDDTSKPKKVAEATTFLQQKDARFTNYLLDESMDDAFEYLDITAIPAVFFYGPDGKEIRRFTLEDVDKQFTYDQVEQAVKDYLDGKPITTGAAPPAKKKK